MESVISSLPQEWVVSLPLPSKIKLSGHNLDPSSAATMETLVLTALPIGLCGALWERLGHPGMLCEADPVGLVFFKHESGMHCYVLVGFL